MQTVAALYVLPDGPYASLEGVDPWPVERDARLYDGPHPVVAHPPCARWGNMWWSARHKGLGLGDDEGCFEAALASVRRWGGVLEHPQSSRAWARFGLLPPKHGRGWERSLFDPGLVCSVDQSAYGHRAQKRTWLYYVGPAPLALDTRTVQNGCNCGRRRRNGAVQEVMGKRERKTTPEPFRDLLLALARGS